MKQVNRLIIYATFLLSVFVLYITTISSAEIPIKEILTLVLFATLAESVSIDIGNKTLSVSSAITLCALISYGPIASVWTSVLSILFRVRKNQVTGKIAHTLNMSIFSTLGNVAMYTLSSAGAAWVYLLFGGKTLSPLSGVINYTFAIAVSDISRYSLILIAAIFTEMLINTLLCATYLHTSGRGQLLHEWINDFFWSFAGLLFVGLMGVLLTAFYLSYGWFMVLVCFAPLFLARYTFSLYSNLRVSYMDTVKSLSDAIEAKDHYTRGHSQRVQEYSALIADELKYTPKQKEILQYAALLHDVGKIGVTETILNKPGKLDELEFDSIKQHPEMGARIISNVKYLKECVPIIKYHHKYYDGSGYPDITKDEKIPYESYILGVADAFDAMTSKRQYREPYTLDRAIEEIRRCSGTQFEPSVAEAFINAFTKQQAKANAQTLPTRRKRRGSSGAVPVVIPAAKDAGKALEPMDSLDSVQS